MSTSPRKTRSVSSGDRTASVAPSKKNQASVEAPVEVAAKKPTKKQQAAEKRQQGLEAVTAAEKRMSEKRASVQAAREAEQNNSGPSVSKAPRGNALGRMFACEDFNDPKAVARWRDITEAHAPGQLESLGLKEWADSMDVPSDASAREPSEAPTEPGPHQLGLVRKASESLSNLSETNTPKTKKKREHSPASSTSSRTISVVYDSTPPPMADPRDQ